MKLEGRAALVAGGAQGIGEGIVRCLAEEGADVSIADINGERAGKVAEAVEALGRKALALGADLTDKDQATGAVRETVDFYGKIDILVNVVGGVSRGTMELFREQRANSTDESMPDFLSFNAEVWDRYYELNLKSHVMLSQAVAPFFIRQRSGNIVNISSVSGRVSEPNHMPYGAMKAGDISITWSLAKALAPYNVRVNCICPGYVYTPLWEMGAAARYNMYKEAAVKEHPPTQQSKIDELTPREFWLNYLVKPSTPLKREQTAEDMGRVVVFFVSDDAKNITGQTLHVDGGACMR